MTSGLRGKRIVITRAADQSQELAQYLRAEGAEPVLYPCIEIVPPQDPTALDDVLKAAVKGQFDWLLITSANTALILAHRLEVLGLSLGDLKVAAIGTKSAEAAGQHLKTEISLVAGVHTAEGLADAMLGVLSTLAGQRILLPQSAIARPVLADRLRDAGAEVFVTEAYRTVMGQGGENVPAMLAGGQIDGLIFTSSSTVTNFLRRLEGEGGHREDLQGVCLAAIGPVTAATMTDLALPVTVMAPSYTLPGLLKVMAVHFESEKQKNYA